jgi:hypothetical protein
MSASKFQGSSSSPWLSKPRCICILHIMNKSRHWQQRKRKGVFVTKGIISLLCLIAGFGSDGFCAVTTHRFITGTAFAKLRGPLQDSGFIFPQAKRASSNVSSDVTCRTQAGDFKDHIGVVIETIGIIT